MILTVVLPGNTAKSTITDLCVKDKEYLMCLLWPEFIKQFQQYFGRIMQQLNRVPTST